MSNGIIPVSQSRMTGHWTFLLNLNKVLLNFSKFREIS